MDKKSLIVENIEYSLYYNLNNSLQESYGRLYGIQEYANDSIIIHELTPNDKNYQETLYKKPYKKMQKALELIKSKIDATFGSNYKTEVGIKNRYINKTINPQNNRIEKNEFIFIYFIYSTNLSEMLITQTIIKNNLTLKNINSILQIIDSDYISLTKEKVSIISNKKYDLVFNPYSSGTFFHEIIGHILEEDNFEFSKISEKKHICPKNINIYENYDCSQKKDDFGDKVYKNIPLILNGNLAHTLSAGNYQTEEYDKVPIPRMRSMYIYSSHNELISSSNNSIFIEDILYAECNYYTGDITLFVNKAYTTSNNEISYFYPFTIIFNVLHFNEFSISMDNKRESYKRLCGKNGSMISVDFISSNLKILWNDHIKLQGV